MAALGMALESCGLQVGGLRVRRTASDTELFSGLPSGQPGSPAGDAVDFHV